MPQIRTESIPKDRYSVYLGKAEEFLTASETALAKGDMNAAASSAAHAAISACDALVAFHLGLRCKGEDHGEITHLLRRLPAGPTLDKERQILVILDVKRVAEYEDRDVTRDEGAIAVQAAKTIVVWARGRLPKG